MTERIEHTAGPWEIYKGISGGFSWMIVSPAGDAELGNWLVARSVWPEDANVIAAAPDLLEAAVLLEKAELAHANCDECEGEDVPELCEKCFPLFDDARVKRRLAIAKATGTKTTTADHE